MAARRWFRWVDWSGNGFPKISRNRPDFKGKEHRFAGQLGPLYENDGSYEWEVADTFSGLCLVRMSSLDTDGQPQDQGDAVFSIIRD